MVFKNQLICLGFFIFRFKLSIWVCLYFSKCEFSSSILHCKIHFVGYYEQDGSDGECKLSIGLWKPQSRFIFHDVNWMFIPKCLICFYFSFVNKFKIHLIHLSHSTLLVKESNKLNSLIYSVKLLFHAYLLGLIRVQSYSAQGKSTLF